MTTHCLLFPHAPSICQLNVQDFVPPNSVCWSQNTRGMFQMIVQNLACDGLQAHFLVRGASSSGWEVWISVPTSSLVRLDPFSEIHVWAVWVHRHEDTCRVPRKNCSLVWLSPRNILESGFLRRQKEKCWTACWPWNSRRNCFVLRPCGPPVGPRGVEFYGWGDQESILCIVTVGRGFIHAKSTRDKDHRCPLLGRILSLLTCFEGGMFVGAAPWSEYDC